MQDVEADQYSEELLLTLAGQFERQVQGGVHLIQVLVDKIKELHQAKEQIASDSETHFRLTQQLTLKLEEKDHII